MLVASSIDSSNASFDAIGPTPVDPSSTYWLAVVAFDGNVHRYTVDSIRVYPLTEFSSGRLGGDLSQDGASWYDQLVGGDLNMFIALISAMMVFLGVIMIIRPKERAAPKPWEMGTMEVEIEEELAREARGISEEEEIESSALPRTEVESEVESVETMPQLEELEEEWWDTDTSVGELLLDSDTEDIDLESLNTLADDLDDQEGSDDIDTSFIDEALDD